MMQNVLKNKLIFISSIVGFFAFFVQMNITLTKKMSEGFSLIYSLNHYLSYFTIIINLALATFLFCYSIYPHSKITSWFKKAAINGAMCVYILIVGIIFYALLYKDLHLSAIEFIVSHIQHAFMPVAYLYFWYSELRDSSLRYWDGVRWLIVPFVYFIYLMVRGQIVGKYPYFFVDIEKFGIPKVAMFAAAILMFFLLVGSLLIFVDRRQPIQAR